MREDNSQEAGPGWQLRRLPRVLGFYLTKEFYLSVDR